jgi:Secretion system C-terminal sorting domain
MIYWYGKSFVPLSDSGYLWSNQFSGKTSIIKYDSSLDTLFTLDFIATETNSRHNFMLLETEQDYLAVGMLRTELTNNVYADLEFIKMDHDGNILYRDTIEIFDQEYQITLSGIYSLSNGGFIVSGSRLYDWDPFIAKFTPEGELDSVFVWGGPENDWLPFLEPSGQDTFMVSYNYTEEYYLNTYYIVRPKLMLFNAVDMSSIWEASSEELITHYFNYSMDKTYDDGYVTCGTNAHSSGQLGVIQRWNALGEVLWTKTYKYSGAIADSFDDLSEFRDIKETADSGLVVCGYYADGTDGIQHAWVLKLDACGDPIYDSCVVVIDGVWDDSYLNKMKTEAFVWPNPFQSQLNLQLPEHSAQIDIYDLMGNLVYSIMSYQLVSKFDLSELPTGVYLIKARLESGLEITKRVVKVE